MSEELDILQKIENYLDGTMSPEEAQAFEDAVHQDKLLAQEVEEAKYTQEAILLANLSMMKEDMAAELKNIEYEPKTSLKKKLWVSVLALSGLSLVGIALYDGANDAEKQANPTQLETNEQVNHTLSEKTTQSEEGVPQKEKHTPSSVTDKTVTQKEDTEVFSQDVSKQEIADTLEAQKPVNNEESTDKNTSSATDNAENESQILCDKGFLISSTPSCEHKATGSITVLTDETIAYNFTLDKISTSHYKGTFNSISAGNHEVSITYGKECTYTESVRVAEEWCPQNKSYSFNPDYGEKWIPVYDKGEEGTFTVYSNTGKVLFTQKFGEGDEYWDGTNSNGVVLPTGTYQAILTYNDGKVEKVKLTIVR